jgi:putative oxidoreductase
VDTSHNRSTSWGLLILRAIVGVVFLMHGGQKLFVLGVPGVAGFMGQLGIPAPGVAALVVSLVEFVGGALLVLGLFARPAAALIAIDMAVAVLKVHLPNGFFLPRGFEFALTLLCVCAALVLLGAGPLSIDGRIAAGRH